MWTQAKIKFRTLLFDDSGVAMAYTIVTFLVFFMICISTYAMSENIRRKMELQNACDAAAYSAAVVQADMLSRIAVLNRALSWTYFQTSKRHMDYIIDVWIDAVQKQWQSDNKHVIDFNKPSCHPRIPFICYYATSLGGIGIEDLKEQFNEISDFRDRKEGEDENYYAAARSEYYDNACMNIIDAVSEGVSGLLSQININGNNLSANSIISKNEYENLASMIDKANANMTIIENEISYLRQNIGNYTESAAKHIMDNNMPDNSDGSFHIISDNTYFADVNDEDDLLAYTGKDAQNLGAGYNTWWTLSSGMIQRSYSSGLTASYECFSTLWEHADVCVPINFIFPFTRTISPTISPPKADDPPVSISDSNNENTPMIKEIHGNVQYLTSQRVTATKLSRDFFGKAGSIVVAAQIKSKNPLSALFESSGIYNQNLYFGRKILAVSAARAGIHLKTCYDGEYSVFYPGENFDGYHNGVWNLCEDDWDAVMLPINRAWCPASEGASQFGKYNKDTEYSSNAILQEVYQRFNRDGECPANVDDVMWH